MTVSVRALAEADLDDADRVFRLAFGTFLGLPHPERFAGDTDYVRTRFRAGPESAFAADRDGAFVGSNFAAHWGSFAFFGPLSVHPELWDQGVGRRLVEPVVAQFDRWGVAHRGLFTFAHSLKHHALYQKFGFYPRFLTTLVERFVAGMPPAPEFAVFSQATDRDAVLARCRELCDGIYAGLDVTSEIRSVDAQRLGDTILVGHEASRLESFAVCHVGPRTEAGTDVVYVKFGAVRAGPGGEAALRRLLDACAAYARSRGVARLLVGANLGRERAYRTLLGHGFRGVIVGVAMEGADPGFNRPDALVLDDWR